MTKKIFSVLIALMMAVAFCGSNAIAGKPADVFLELSSDTATLWPAEQEMDYLRGRIILIDDDRELADTGEDDVEVVIKSKNFEDDAVIDTGSEATDALDADEFACTDAGDAEFGGGLTNFWQEFAISYDCIDEIADDVIEVEVTLDDGTVVTRERAVTIVPPEANRYVVRTGGFSTLPDVLGTLPGPKADKGATKEAGDSTDIDVFAAYLNGAGDYIFTDRLPEGADVVEVQPDVANGATGLFDSTYGMKAYKTEIELTEGHGSAEVTIEDLYLTELLAKAAEADGIDTTAEHMAAMAPLMEPSGISLTWIATGLVATETVTLTGSDELSFTEPNIFGYTEDGSADQTFCRDISLYAPDSLDKIIIAPLPVNVTNNNASVKYASYTSAEGGFGALNVTALDALLLNEDPFETPGKHVFDTLTGTTSFGAAALIGLDKFNNLAPFAEGDFLAFQLDKDVSGTDTDINSSTAELAPFLTTGHITPTYAGSYSTSSVITATYAYQAFLPFYVTATNGSVNIANLFIDSVLDAETQSTTIDLEDEIEDIDSRSEGIDLIGRDSIGAITLTTADDLTAIAGSEAGDEDFTLFISPTTPADEQESSFTLRIKRQEEGKADVLIGAKDATSGSDSLTFTNDTSEGYAEKDMAIFTELGAEPIILVWKGKKGTTAIRRDTPGAMIERDGGDLEPSKISPAVDLINIFADVNGDHNTAVIDNDLFDIKDAFGNTYGTDEDSSVGVKVYTASDNGSPTDTENPAVTKSEIDDDDIVIEVDPTAITPDNEKAVAVLTTEQGNVSAEIALNLRGMQGLGIMPIFIPVNGIGNTPIAVYLQDQNGDLARPFGRAWQGNVVANDVDLEIEDPDNGSLSDTGDSTLSGTVFRRVLTAEPDTDKTSMEVEIDADDVETTIITLDFSPDFDPATIKSVEATSCGIVITIEDNKATDAAATTVVVKDSDGEDITDTLTRTDSDNGTEGTITLKAPGVQGVYSVTITTVDATGLVGEEETRTVNVTECTDEVSCSVDPTFANPGDENVEVVISGEFTSFSDASVVSFACEPDVTINATTVNSATEIVLDISVAADAAEGACAVSVDDLTCEFTIGIGPVTECTDADNDTYAVEGGDCGEVDCDDTDPEVNPGADEDCGDDGTGNGIDDNCDGQIDEGCDEIPGDCELESISPESVNKFIIALARITVTASADLEADAEISLDTEGIRLLGSPTVDGNTISQRIFIGPLGPRSGDVAVSVSGCQDTVTFTIE